MTVASIHPMNARYPHNFVEPSDAPKPAPTDDFLLGRQKFGAKMPLSACYTQAQRDGWLAAYNRKGYDSWLRCCESEGMPADVVLRTFES